MVKTVLLVLLATAGFTGIIRADNSPVGTWSGTWQNGELSDVFTITMEGNGSLVGTWMEPFDSGVYSIPLTGTYSFNSSNNQLVFSCEGNEVIDGFQFVYYVDGEGTVSGDDFSGDYVVTSYYYDAGNWWPWDDNDHGTLSAHKTSIPLRAISPSPGTGATNESINLNMRWSNGGGATHYDLYFSSNPVLDNTALKGTFPERVYNPGTLSYSTTYYWRIDARNSNGVATGEKWSFRTKPAPAIPSIMTDVGLLDFGNSEVSQIVHIWNAGTGTLEYDIAISSGASYYSVTPLGGVSGSTAQRVAHMVSVDRSLMAIGEQAEGVLTITSTDADNSPYNLPLSATNFSLSDFDRDGVTGTSDLLLFAAHWLQNNCADDNWCALADIDRSTSVDLFDFAYLAEDWCYHDPDAGLVLYYTMNETNVTAGSIIVDSSDNANHGIANDAMTSVDGVIDGALNFNGIDDYVDIADNSTLDMTTAMTVTLWMKQPVLAIKKALVAKWDYPTQGSWALQTDPRYPEELSLYIATALDDDGSGCSARTTDADMVAGNWYHVAFVYDGTGAVNADRLKIYVDGEEKTLSMKGAVPSSLQNSTASVKIGEFGGTVHRYFNGTIDEVRIYNRALSQAELQ